MKSSTYIGLPCKLGHGTERYSAGGSCIVCSKEKSKRRWEEGTKKRAKYDPVYRRNRNLMANYGLTLADYDRMAEDQGNGCAICGGPPTGNTGRFHVDHCHKTGNIRSLLCGKCNTGLGSFDDSPEKLRLAIAYLGRY